MLAIGVSLISYTYWQKQGIPHRNVVIGRIFIVVKMLAIRHLAMRFLLS